MRRRLIAVAAILASLTIALPAMAGTAQPMTVSENPVDNTPHVLDGIVRAIAVVGGTVVVGGEFTRVTDAGRHTVYPRRNLFAYELSTGRVLTFAPPVDGAVNALATGAGGTVYAGGAFRHIAGVAQRGLAQLRVDTGAAVPAFAAAINQGDVRGLAVNGRWLYVGGAFTAIGSAHRVALARLATDTGAVDADFDLNLGAPNLSRTKVEDVAVSPNGSRLVAIGAIEQAAGQYRAQLVVADTTPGVKPSLANWWTDAFANPCRAGFDTYLRGVDFSPDGSYFVVVTTGRLTGPGRTCDSALRFDIAGTGGHAPVWVNHTGGDSLYSVCVTGAAVYVGGHQRWMNNPYGHESAGPGAVSRPGIAALDPARGGALAWNPTRSRGVGVQAMVATPSGLLVGSDTDQLGHEYHGRIGMFPLS
jgi:hypothetical protein